MSCDGGQGEVQVVAGLGASEETHSHPQKTHVHGYRRKKTPSQLRREERRRNERAEITVLRKVTDTDEAEKKN